jgi:hypothetical protein
VSIHISKNRGGNLINYKTAVYKQKVTINVRLNNKVEGRAKLGKTLRMIGLLYAAFKLTIYRL